MSKFYLSVFALFLLYCTAGAQQVIFNGSYAAGVQFVPFGGSTTNVTIDNTVTYGGNATLNFAVPSTNYMGGALVPTAPENLTAYNAVTFWAKASAAQTLDKAGFGNNTSDANYSVEYAGIPLTTSWQKFIIPIPDPSKLTAMSGLWHIAQGSQNGAYTIWVADVQYEKITGGVIGTPTASMATETVTETVGATFTASGIAISIPVNGTAEVLSAVAPVYYNYTSSVAGIATFDTLGNITAAKAGQTVITATLASTPVTGSITLNVTGLVAPSTAAPTPTIPAADVTALFNSSNVYVNSPIDAEGYIAPWCAAKLTYPYVIPGLKDTILDFYDVQYTGTEFTQHEIDATTKKYFHIDVWTPNVSSLSVKLVDFAPSGAYNGATNVADQKTFTTAAGTLTQGVWNTLVIDLDSLPGLNKQYNYMAQLLLVDNDNGGVGGGTVFTDNIYFSTQGTLPVTFLSFNGQLQNNQAVLNWSTTNEINNKGYYVERSQDGQAFADVSFVAGKGSGQQVNNYTFSDAKLLTGANYYRLKQVDLDGNFAYSSVIKIDYSKFSWSVLGNGAAGSWIQLQLDHQANVNFKVFSVEGQLIKEVNKGVTQPGTYTIPLNLGGVSHGMYIVKLQLDNKNYSQKIVN